MMTLLTFVQNILSEMNSDPVNSIQDTSESTQIAFMVRDSYFDILYKSVEWNFTRQMLQLDGASNLLAPTQLIIPQQAVRLNQVKYDKRTLTGTDTMFQDLIPMENEAFMDMVKGRSSSAANIVQVDVGTGVKIYCFNDRPPAYFTSFDDVNIFCDAYDSTVDSTLQTSKTEVLAIIQQPWYFEDAFIPNGPYNLESLILNEAKARAFATLKGERNKHAEDYVTNNTTRSKFTTVKSVRPRQVVQWGRPC